MLGFDALAKLPLASLPDQGQELSPDLFVDADTFYTPTIIPGEVILLPALFADPDVFYGPVIGLFISPPLYVDPDVFHSPFVGLGMPPIPYPANICQHSGFQVPPDKLTRQWNGIVARREDFDRRHPQEYLRPVRDRIKVSVPRPEAEDSFLSAGEVTPADL